MLNMLPRFLRTAMLPMAMTAISMAGCNSASDSRDQVTVLAAASSVNVMQAVVELFEQQHDGVDVVLSTGPSNGLATQIMAGAPADIYISAHRQWTDVLEQNGLAASTVPLFANQLVLVVPRKNAAQVNKVHDLLSNRVSKIAIAAENVPAGMYAEQALRKLGLYEELNRSNRLAFGSSVRIALTHVEQGEAEAGFVYATDARLSERVEVIESFQGDMHEEIQYYVLILKSAADDPHVRKFGDFLASDEARQIIDRFGFEQVNSTR